MKSIASHPPISFSFFGIGMPLLSGSSPIPRRQSRSQSGKMSSRFVIVSSNSQTNVKEHATLSARARVDHGVEVETTLEHENRAADRGCCVSTCCASSLLELVECCIKRRLHSLLFDLRINTLNVFDCRKIIASLTILSRLQSLNQNGL